MSGVQPTGVSSDAGLPATSEVLPSGIAASNIAMPKEFANPAIVSGFQDILGYLNFSSGKPDGKFQDRLNRCHPEWGWPNPWESFEAALLARLGELEQSSAAFKDSAQARAVLQLTFHELWPAYRRHHADLLFHLRDVDFQQPLFLARLFEAVLQQPALADAVGELAPRLALKRADGDEAGDSQSGGGATATDERSAAAGEAESGLNASRGATSPTLEVVTGALDSLNDFLGFRPVAVLENQQKMEPYPHERFRPVPIYFKGVGAGKGPYQELITRTMELFQTVPLNLSQNAHFDLSHVDEISVDVRAHDHHHPVYKRTNYMFGEWDPHFIDTKGYYRRFVLRKIILDSLLNWMAEQKETPREELLFDSAAVLCGTMLMASAISGSGPETHDSSITLTSLLPKVARQRDMFYERLLEDATGERAKRLRESAKKTQQPFGHVRQSLNLYLANFGSRQIQYRQLAQLYAQLGQPAAARETAAIIPSVSARFACEIHWRITAAHRHLSSGQLLPAVSLIAEIEDHFRRGIECGGLPDPWNILGFQGQFPLFGSREDSIPDQRLDELLTIVEQYLSVYSRALSESAAQGDRELTRRLSDCFQTFAEYWDQFATTTVEDMIPVAGKESWESATHVADVLSEWRAAGEAAGDISFWRRHIDRFTTAKSYALVVKALIDKKDFVAAMALLMQWLSLNEEVGIESGSWSLPALMIEWMNGVTDDSAVRQSRLDTPVRPEIDDPRGEHQGDTQDGQECPSYKIDPTSFVADRWSLIRRCFAYLEVNAGELWSVPHLDEMEAAVIEKLKKKKKGKPPRPKSDEDDDDLDSFDDDDDSGALLDPDLRDEEDEDDVFRSAYDEMVFKDTADDGVEGDMMESGSVTGPTELEYLSKSLEPRLKFLVTLAQLWQMAVGHFMRYPPPGLEKSPKGAKRPEIEDPNAILSNWLKQLTGLQNGLRQLMTTLWEYDIPTPSGEHDSNVEYDMQMQTKLYLVQTLIGAQLACRIAERGLGCFLPGTDSRKKSKAASEDLHMTALYRSVLRGDVDEVRSSLPSLLTMLARKPLLYVPLDVGGHPKQVLAARLLQSDIRFLLQQLPRLGLLKDTWHLLRTAHRMEKASRPAEMAVTEFDRLFRTAVRSSVESLLRCATQWPGDDASRRDKHEAPASGRSSDQPPDAPNDQPDHSRARRASAERDADETSPFSQEQIVELLQRLLTPFVEEWIAHSQSMRLSAVESMKRDPVWDDVCGFIGKYGAELFHAKMLTLGNVRAILHNGIPWFLNHLAETRDPIRPMPLLDDLDNGVLELETAEHLLELIYTTVVDKFDRFLEYNTTTTQSDYGEKFFYLLDFLRIEADYDRDAWNFTPLNLTHQVLCQWNLPEAVAAWERSFEKRCRESSSNHLKNLQAIEKKYGMRLPSVSDRLRERFTKPLAVNRMMSWLPQVVADAKVQRAASTAFNHLRQEIDAYLVDTTGSGIEIPSWMQNLDKEVTRLNLPAGTASNPMQDPDINIPPRLFTLKDLESQLTTWHQIGQRKRAAKKKPQDE